MSDQFGPGDPTNRPEGADTPPADSTSPTTPIPGAPLDASPYEPHPTAPIPEAPAPYPGASGPYAAAAQDPYAAAAPTAVAYPEYAPWGSTEPVEPAPRPAGALTRPAVLIPLIVVLALVAGLLGGVVGYGVADRAESSSLTDTGATLGAAGAGDSQRPDESIAGIAARVLPTVVSIAAVSAGGEGGTGSGFVVRPGYVLTNNHVVASAADGGRITVTYEDNERDTARIVGRDSSYDLAVLKVDRTDLAVATLGNSDNAVVGDAVVAIGSPLGLQGTVTSGIVSSTNRPVTTSAEEGATSDSFISAIQTDAAINPGNSGGPLVDSSAAVIGVNSAIASLGSSSLGSQAGSIGLGFAIPINQARRVAEEIIRTGRSTYPIIGASVDVSFEGPGARIATRNTPSGVPPLTADGPAAKAGLKAGDVVLRVEGRPVNGASELIVAIRSYAPGQTITLQIKDGDSTRDVDVTLGTGE